MSRHTGLFLAAFCAIAPVASASAQWTPAPVGPMVAARGSGDMAPAMRPLKLARLVMKMRRGETFGQYKTGLLCLRPNDIIWARGGRWDFDTEELDDVFRDEMIRAGFTLAGNPSNLFEDPEDSSAEYLIGGTIGKLHMEVCYPAAGMGDYDSAKGSATVEVEWQVYSQIDRKVIGTLKTSGAARNSNTGRTGNFGLILDAFGDAVRKLAENQGLRAALTGPRVSSNVARKPSQGLTPLQIKASAVAPVSVGDAVGSTVLIFAGDGFGSGFLISSDGYVVTNQHVVGGVQYLKLRWSDGSETLGEVLRSDKPRDVALIKTDAKGRKALRLRTQPVTIGEDIYAIGAPRDPKLQSTVTKGIVSGMRIIDGLNYIQGDVGVTHGNSGGPIIDGKGQVVGLTSSGREDATMVNFFIPIGEARDFLGLQMVQAK